MHDEAEVGADGQIRYGDQVRPRLLQEFQDLDKTDKLLANPAIEHQLGHHYPGQEMHESAVVENREQTGTIIRQQNVYFRSVPTTGTFRHSYDHSSVL